MIFKSNNAMSLFLWSKIISFSSCSPYHPRNLRDGHNGGKTDNYCLKEYNRELAVGQASYLLEDMDLCPLHLISQQKPAQLLKIA